MSVCSILFGTALAAWNVPVPLRETLHLTRYLIERVLVLLRKALFALEASFVVRAPVAKVALQL